MAARAITSKRVLSATAACVALCAWSGLPAKAQHVQPQPATDSSAQSSPLTPPPQVPQAPVNDTSAQASPVSRERYGRPSISSATPIPIALGEDIDSGRLMQGQNIKAQLTGPVALHGGAPLPTGTPVVLTVIETVPAGRIMAQGEFSLQVIRVGNIGVYTDTLVFDGKPGHQDLPDSAPALGTDAGLPTGAALTFHVEPPPTAAENIPQSRKNGPGSVDGVASGSPPPPSALKSTFDNAKGAGSGNTPGQQQKAVSPGDTTTNQQTQQLGRPSVVPNLPQSPAETSPTGTRPQ